MKVPNFIYQIWTSVLVFVFTILISPGVEPLNGIIGMLVAGTIFAFVVMFIPRFVEFFKLKVNFWSFLVFGSFLTVGYMFLMRYIFVGFLKFSAFNSDEALFGIGSLRGFNLTEIQVIVIAGIISIVLVSLHEWLMEK